jgi:mannose-1-phosphate guanylyltransferase
MYGATDHHWGIVLAGGDGRRLKSFIRLHWGSMRPKQYCTLIGGQSMLRHTLARAERLLSPERLLTVVSRQHLGYAREELYDRPPSTVIVQPCNRGTGPGILLPLLHIYHRDPNAIVTLLPSDHFIVEEERFMAAVQDAASFVRSSSRHLVLLGVEPDRPETEYGWIEVGEKIENESGQQLPLHPLANLAPREGNGMEYDWEKQLYRVKSFWEKPRAKMAKALYQSGCLWNTLILTGKVWMMLLLFQTLTPRLYLRFQQVQPVLSGYGEAEVLQEIYKRLHSVNFSHTILTRSVGALSVLPIKGIYWSDWGNPEQVSKDVARFAPASLHNTRLSHTPSLELAG